MRSEENQPAAGLPAADHQVGQPGGINLSASGPCGDRRDCDSDLTDVTTRVFPDPSEGVNLEQVEQEPRSSKPTKAGKKRKHKDGSSQRTSVRLSFAEELEAEEEAVEPTTTASGAATQEQQQLGTQEERCSSLKSSSTGSSSGAPSRLGHLLSIREATLQRFQLERQRVSVFDVVAFEG